MGLADSPGLLHARIGEQTQQFEKQRRRKMRGESVGIAVGVQFDQVSADCVAFLLAGDAFKPLIARIEELLGKIDVVEKAVELQALGADLDSVHEGLTLLSEIVAGLAVDDATARTKILEGISEGAGFTRSTALMRV